MCWKRRVAEIYAHPNQRVTDRASQLSIPRIWLPMFYCGRHVTAPGQSRTSWLVYKISSCSWHCEGCGKDFTTWDVLAKHFNTHKRPFQCQECQFSAATVGQLRKHMLAIHKMELSQQKHWVRQQGVLLQSTNVTEIGVIWVHTVNSTLVISPIHKYIPS